MKHSNVLAMVLSMGIWSLMLTAFANEISDDKELVAGNTAFAFNLYDRLKQTEGNLFLSPYSISTALAMTYAGARGNTEKQMAQVLHFILDQEHLHPAFASIEAGLNAVQKKGEIQLCVANALWPEKSYTFLKDYLVLLETNYGASVTPLDYKRATDAARKEINTWVEQKTNNKIKDLIQKGVLDPATRLVLTDAIYFKGNWANQFKKKDTEDLPFNVAPGKSVSVPMMTQKQRFKYMENDSLQVLEMPYAGDDLSMIILLPREVDGLAGLEAELTVENLNAWMRRLVKREVQVFLPKFEMTSQFSLGETLASMGMPDAFSMSADFSGMDGTTMLYISAVVHKAFVAVDEEGTEAAAATAVVMRLKAMPRPPLVFRADHPFVFMICDNRLGSILFLGRVTDPTAL